MPVSTKTTNGSFQPSTDGSSPNKKKGNTSGVHSQAKKFKVPTVKKIKNQTPQVLKSGKSPNSAKAGASNGRFPQPKIGVLTSQKKDSVSQLFSNLKIGDAAGQGQLRNSVPFSLGRSSFKACEAVPYEEMSIIPTFRDILSTELPFLKPNREFGAFLNARDYVETHFRLFHEDFLRPLKEGVQDFLKYQNEYLSGRRSVPKGNIRLYRDVKYETPTNVKKSQNKAQYVRLKPSYYMNVNWEESSQLLPGSLLILSHDNFKTAFIATVQNYRNENLLNRGILGILWVDETPYLNSEYKFTMIESESFFQSYRYTLEVLKTLDPACLPLSKYIVHGSPDVGAPKYLTSFNNRIKLGGKEVSPLDCNTWPTAKELKLNDNQFKALKACLTKEFAIVQGPPGTGKTFLALQVMEVLLRNHSMWNPKGQKSAPILVACYTNHALDQFLEGVLKIYEEIGQEPSLVRVGGGGESEVLEKYNISKFKPDQRRAAVMKSQIVGMTTTGAAKYDNLLEHASPRIVIVEEAAEVLESHIIPCLLPQCQHLILIGDHQQLQPCINVQELSTKFNLDISLFERMVNNKLHLCTLNVQHRMAPSISNLVAGTIYKDLKNAPNVFEYPKVLGMKSNLYFFTHDKFESRVPGSASKVNKYEAEFLLSLCRYVIQQGYPTKSVTILATYNGQVDLIKEWVQKDEIFEGVEVTTVDGFQGKENDIILLSLVRSNDESKIGFLKKKNRICVALSRAKHGLYMVGNMSQLASRSKTWKKIRTKLSNSSAIGPSLPIQCQIHGTVQKIQSPQDFKRLAPEGGCLLPCKQKLSCDHECESICHKKDHGDYKCQLDCDKICVRGHSCKALCYEPCPPCTVKWISNLPCRHEAPVPCFVAENEESTQKGLKFCTKRCGYVFSESEGGCGHTCQGSCTSCMQGRFHIKCEVECMKMLPCGHKCQSQCYEECGPCQQACQNKCEHTNCNATCGEPCLDCEEPCGWSCDHETCTKLCSQICDREPCDEPCSKTLDCGHLCPCFCGEPCPKQCRYCDPGGFFKSGDKDKEAGTIERYVLLEDCGHAVENRTLFEICFESYLSSVGSGDIFKCPVSDCLTIITRSRRYNFEVKHGRSGLKSEKKNREDQVRVTREQTIHNIKSVINENPLAMKSFPYVIKFMQKKLTEGDQFLRSGWWSLDVFNKFLQVAVGIVSLDDSTMNHNLKGDLIERFYAFFYILIQRKFPWSKEELKDSEKEFQRLWNLSQTYFLNTSAQKEISTIKASQQQFDKLYSLLRTRQVYDEILQNQVDDIFQKLSKQLQGKVAVLSLSKWVAKPTGFLNDNNFQIYVHPSQSYHEYSDESAQSEDALCDLYVKFTCT